MPPRGAALTVLMTRHAMPMDRTRWKLPLALGGALVAAEAGVLLLRPRGALPRPAPVRAETYFTPDELRRAAAYRRPQRALTLTGIGIDAAVLGWLVARPPRALRRRRRRPVLAGAATGAALTVGLGAAGLPVSAVAHR